MWGPDGSLGGGRQSAHGTVRRGSDHGGGAQRASRAAPCWGAAEGGVIQQGMRGRGAKDGAWAGRKKSWVWDRVPPLPRHPEPLSGGCQDAWAASGPQHLKGRASLVSSHTSMHMCAHMPKAGRAAR